jgi:uncharacterized protein YciI/stress-induced morphogen
MWYAIIAEDVPNSLEKRMTARPEHLARLTMLQNEGRLLLAGPFPAMDSEDPGPAGFSGSLIVAEFNDLVAAKAWGDADPFVAAGVYCNVIVKPFRKTLPQNKVMDLVDTIRNRLTALEPISLEIEDDSAAHAGHKGNMGGGYFNIKMTSSHFSEKSQIMRHRLIYQALNDLIPQKIHALSIIAISPTDPK